MEPNSSYNSSRNKLLGAGGLRNHYSISAISESWTRCRDFGLQSSGNPVDAVVSAVKMTEIMEKNERIRRLVTPELELLYNQIAGTNFMVAYAHSTGVVIDSIQDDDFQAGEGGKAVIPGSVWIEKNRGTNALGLALHSRQPQIVVGPDHFFHKLSDLSCFACPIIDHEEKVVGVIDATSDATARNQHTLALVKLASRNVENRLFEDQFSDSLIVSFHARHEYLPTTSVALIALDAHGLIQGANATAKAMLNGLNLSNRLLFDDVFEVSFSTFIDRLRGNEIIQIRDLMGSVVFMTVRHPLLRRVLNIPGIARAGRPPLSVGKSEQPKTEKYETAAMEEHTVVPAQKIYDDETLKRQIKLAERAIKIGLPINIEGDRGTGKGELAREIHNRVFGDNPFIVVDANLLTAENFEQQLFGELGKLAFFECARKKSNDGKFWRAKGGSIFFDNADKMPLDAQRAVYQVITTEDTKRNAANNTTVQAFLFSGGKGWSTSLAEDRCVEEFREAVQGYHILIPPLARRSDFQKIAHALVADISPRHTLSKVAMNCLEKMAWPGNIRQMRKALQLAITKSDVNVIRQEIQNYLVSFTGNTISPCEKCTNSPVRIETCVLIKKTWLDCGGNVSLVARRLRVSRNTVYKHIS